MRKEEVLEVELVEEARVGSEQGALGTGRVVHQTVGNEARRASLSTADYAVGEGDGTLFGEVERCLIGADATYLTSQHATGQRVPWFEPFDGLAVTELVEAGAVAVHGAAERLDEAVGQVVRMGRKVIQQAREVTDAPEAVELELGLKLTAKTGFVIAESSGEAHVKVILKWTVGA